MLSEQCAEPAPMSHKTRETREKLMLATEHLLRTDGLARLTTRAIAREAGVAEGALYHHFKDKAALLLAIVRDRMSDFRATLDDLPARVGKNTVRENLEQVLDIAYESQHRIAPVLCSLFADRKLLASVQKTVAECGTRPESPVAAVAAYLGAEQGLGRVARDISPQAAAQLMLGGCFHAAIFDLLLGQEETALGSRRLAQEMVQSVMRGLKPHASSGSPCSRDAGLEVS